MNGLKLRKFSSPATDLPLLKFAESVQYFCVQEWLAEELKVSDGIKYTIILVFCTMLDQFEVPNILHKIFN